MNSHSFRYETWVLLLSYVIKEDSAVGIATGCGLYDQGMDFESW
jgi:hypothetical protein